MTTIGKNFGMGGAGGMGAAQAASLAEPVLPKTPVLGKDAKFDAHKREEVKQVANEFEALFFNLVLKSMRDTVTKGGLIDGGNAEDIYKGMLDDEYAKMMAAQRTTGLGDNVERYLLEAMGASPEEARQAAPEPDAAASETPPAATARLEAALSSATAPRKAMGLKAYRDQTLIEAPLPATMDAGDRPELRPTASPLVPSVSPASSSKPL